MNEELKRLKDRYVVLFGVAVLARICAGAATNFDPTAPREVGPALLNILAFGLALTFFYYTFRLCRALGMTWYGTAAALFGSLLPLINLIVVIVLLGKYKKAQNVRFDFLMRDLPA